MRSSSDTCGTEWGINNTQDKKGECNNCSGKNIYEKNCLEFSITDSGEKKYRSDHPKKSKLFVIGTGPGSIDHISKRAVTLLRESDCVAGYTTYIELIKEIIKDKKIISTGMTREVDRVELAISEALKGKWCSIISGGDSGIYAMAGLVFEICQKKKIKLVRHCDGEGFETQENKNVKHSCEQHIIVENIIEIEVVPGIPAIAAGAALLGAPLTHDFAAISLSDLLTPWEKIEKRIIAAASADFVIAIYNPRSKKRDWQLTRAKELILAHRNQDTLVGIVTSAMRDEEKINITTLQEMDAANVGMQTIVIVGNSSSLQYLDFMFTPRGYSDKYERKFRV